jgi:glycosyltransferase involved in cell wall biosynthesis
MKVIIQIPCYNEAETLAETLRALPRSLPGVDAVEWLVVDDGSADATADIARREGVDHVLRLPVHSGLARAFAAALDFSLRRGADIIVNTDGDNQYEGADVAGLVVPILEGRSQIVVGDRGVADLRRFSPAKRAMQKLGSWVVGRVSRLDVPDAASGFRAFSREAALRLIVLSEYSYTLETLIQAGIRGFGVTFVPVRTGPKTRASRLIRNLPHYLSYQLATILRTAGNYRPLRVFLTIGTVFIAAGLVPAIRYLFFLFQGTGRGHVQSVILAAILLIVGFQICLIGVVADLVGSNRKILEEALFRLRKIELERPAAEDPDHRPDARPGTGPSQRPD